MTFTSLQAGEGIAHVDSTYQYSLTAWTEIQGYQVEFFLGFMDDGVLAGWGTRGQEVGEYIEEPTSFPPEGRLYILQSGEGLTGP